MNALQSAANVKLVISKIKKDAILAKNAMLASLRQAKGGLLVLLVPLAMLVKSLVVLPATCVKEESTASEEPQCASLAKLGKQ